MARRVTGLFLLGSALAAAAVVAVLARRDGHVDPVLVAVVGVGVGAAAMLVVGDHLWYRRARRPEDGGASARSMT